MIYREFLPGPPLSAYIDRFWYCEGHAPAHPVERVMPSGSGSLVFALAADWLSVPRGHATQHIERGSPAVVVLPRTEYEVVVTADFARLGGVHFRPWGLAAFFPEMPTFGGLKEVPLDGVWGAFASRLRDRLVNVRTADGVFAIMEEALRSRFRGLSVAPRLAHAVRALARGQGQAVVRPIAAELGYSERQFRRVFTAHVGLTPKQFHRIRRFRTALDRAAQCQEVEWVQLALECGYADQSHFVRDFRAFSGVSPTAYFNRRGAWTGHLPIDPAGFQPDAGEPGTNPPGSDE